MKRAPKVENLSQREVQDLFSYDQETGIFRNRVARGVRGIVGAQTGSKTREGYIKLVHRRQAYMAHRLAWLYILGSWPGDDIDHIDGDRTNNRWANLRCVSRSVNCQNQKIGRSDSSTGLLGVVPRGNGRFRAKIQVRGTTVLLGNFPSAESAHEAYLVAKRRLHEGCTI